MGGAHGSLKAINQLINQSDNQSINQSFNQLINQSSNQLTIFQKGKNQLPGYFRAALIILHFLWFPYSTSMTCTKDELKKY